MDLVELYEPIIKSVIKKYLGYANKVGLDYDDLFQEASMAVLRAENTYKDDKGMIQTYKTEIEKYLGANKSNICILRWFEDMSYEYITKVTGINNIYSTLRESRMTLIRKSLLFRNEYRRIHHIDEYDTERVALLDS